MKAQQIDRSTIREVVYPHRPIFPAPTQKKFPHTTTFLSNNKQQQQQQKMFNPFRSVLNFFKREFIVSEKKREKNLKSLKCIVAFGVLSFLIISEAQTVSPEYKQQKKKINDLIQPIQQDAFNSIYEVVERAKRKIEQQEVLGY